MKTKILHIGCGDVYLTKRYDDIEEVRLDLCPEVYPDIQLDVCELKRIPECSFDGVWMCHVLEHVYEHQIPIVLGGIRHVLKDNGFLLVRVPDLRAVLKEVLNRECRLDDTFYIAASGAEVRPLDIIYGYQNQVSYETSNGVLYNQHKIGFDTDFLLRALQKAGFKRILMTEADWEVKAIACMNGLPEWVERNFKIKNEILQTV